MAPAAATFSDSTAGTIGIRMDGIAAHAGPLNPRLSPPSRSAVGKVRSATQYLSLPRASARNARTACFLQNCRKSSGRRFSITGERKNIPALERTHFGFRADTVPDIVHTIQAPAAAAVRI